MYADMHAQGSLVSISLKHDLEANYTGRER